MIEAKIVVTNDIKFDAGLNTIVITGPNTGGKTITLKTVGLLTILAQSGLPILAADGSRIHLLMIFLPISVMSNPLSKVYQLSQVI